MTVSNPAGDLAERVARWAAAGEQYEVEFKSELRRNCPRNPLTNLLNDPILASVSVFSGLV